MFGRIEISTLEVLGMIRFGASVLQQLMEVYRKGTGKDLLDGEMDQQYIGGVAKILDFMQMEL